MAIFPLLTRISASRHPLLTSIDPRITPVASQNRVISSVVEHCLHTAGVSGSNPLSPTIAASPPAGNLHSAHPKHLIHGPRDEAQYKSVR